MYRSLILLFITIPVCSAPSAVADDPPTPAESVEGLVDAARRGDAEAYEAALAEIEGLGERGRTAVPLLRHSLQDGDPQVRAVAASALGHLALQADEVLPELIALFDDTAHTQLGPVGYVSAHAAARFGAAAVPHLIETLQHEKPQVRRSAAMGVCPLGEDAKDVVPTLIEVLPESDLETRRPFLMNALLCTGRHARPALPLLIEYLDDEDFHTQYWSCRVLGAIGAEAEAAVPKLIELVEQGVGSVRRNAAAALGKIGPVIGQEGLQVLIKALNEPLQVVREDAVIGLGRLGEFARPAVPAIEEILQEGSTFAARSQAAKSLWLLDPQSQTPPRVLLEQLQGDNEPWVAAEVLGEFAEEMGVIDEVADLLDEPNSETRLYAATVLGAMGEKAAHTADRLKPLLEDPNEDVREVAIQALHAVRFSDF